MPASPSFSGGSSRRLVGSGHTSTQTKYRYLIPFPTSPTNSLSSSPSSSLSSSPSSGPYSSGNFFPRDFGALLNKPPSFSRARRAEIGPEDVTYKIFKCEKGRNYAIQFYEKKAASYGGGMSFGGRASEGQGLCLGFAMYEVPEDVEFGDLEKRVFYDDEAGEWCLELSNEVVRGRRMKRKNMMDD
jgi:hypothetical protein